MRFPLPGLFIFAVGLVVSGSGCAGGGPGTVPVARTEPAARAAEPAPPVLRPFEGVVVAPGRQVQIEARVCLDAGWLEQIACSPRTREHESLMVVDVPPSSIHAALLLAGFEPGAPGHWRFDDETLSLVPPRGEKLDVLVRYERPDGSEIELPVREWIRDHHGEQVFPETPWVFGGSVFADHPTYGEHYVADATGSIVGLVTFGDEVVGFLEVLADQEDVQPPEWEANTDALPPPGTRVWLILRRHGT